MIVIGVDVHKHSLTAAAVDETGRLLAERTLAGGEDGLIGWAAALDPSRIPGAGGITYLIRRTAGRSQRDPYPSLVTKPIRHSLT